MNWRWGRRGDRAAADLRRLAARGRRAVEESGDLLVVLDAGGRVVAASRRARETLPGVRVGRQLPAAVLADTGGEEPRSVFVDTPAGREELLYLPEPPVGRTRYEELRVGFTAAVSHELRTPLARQLALLDTALLGGEDQVELIGRARDEVEHMRDLIDEVMFLSELETGREVVSLGTVAARPVLEEVAAELAGSAARAGVALRVECDPEVEVPLRERMLRVVAQNLMANAIRYAGAGATCVASVRRAGETVVLTVADDGRGVPYEQLPRLFERFYRADPARASRGTGLGLAIVKHIAVAAGGTVDASGGPGRGLSVRLRFRLE